MEYFYFGAVAGFFVGFIVSPLVCANDRRNRSDRRGWRIVHFPRWGDRNNLRLCNRRSQPDRRMSKIHVREG